MPPNKEDATMNNKKYIFIFMLFLLGSLIYVPKERINRKIDYVFVTQDTYIIHPESNNISTKSFINPQIDYATKYMIEHNIQRYRSIRYDIIFHNIAIFGLALACIYFIRRKLL